MTTSGAPAPIAVSIDNLVPVSHLDESRHQIVKYVAVSVLVDGDPTLTVTALPCECGRFVLDGAED